MLVLHAGQSCGAEGNQHGQEEGAPHQRALAPHYLPGDALIAEDLGVAQVSEHAVGGVEGGQGQSEGGQDPGPSGLGALDGQGQQDPLAQPTRPGDGWARPGELGCTTGCDGTDCCGHGGLLFVLVGCLVLASRGFLTRDLSIKDGLGQGGGGQAHDDDDDDVGTQVVHWGYAGGGALAEHQTHRREKRRVLPGQNGCY